MAKSATNFNVSERVGEAGLILGALGVIGFIGVIWLLIYGNLSTNLGFAVGTTGFNSTENVIANITDGFNTFFTFSNTFFTIAAIVLLIFMFLGLLSIVVLIMRMQQGGGGRFSE